METLFDNCLAVFQGGGCKALTYIGAYKSALKHGVHFNELAGTSAGSIVAALIAAGATPEQLEEFAHKVPYKKLFTPNISSYFLSLIVVLILFPLLFVVLLICFQFKKIKKLLTIRYIPLWRHVGMYDIEPLRALLENELRRLTGKREEVKFKDLIPNLHVVASDIYESKEKVWDKENNPEESVTKAVCASCAIPIFFQPIENRYVDGGILSNAPTHIFAKKLNYHKILSFQTESKTKTPTNLFGFIKQLISTIIDGAVSLQNSFGVEVYPIKILINDIEATDFNIIDSAKVDELIQLGSDSFEYFWESVNSQSNDISVNALNKNINSYEQMYSLIATYSNNIVSEVFVSCSNTKWVWILFPTILKWLNCNAPVVVYAPIIKEEDPSNFAKEERTRRLLLKRLGVLVEDKGDPNVNGFFLQHKIKGETRWQGVFYTERPSVDNHNVKLFQEGCYYDHKLDGKAIEAWVGKLRIKKEQTNWPKLRNLFLRPLDDETIVTNLQELQYYKNATMTYQTVNIEELLFLNHHIRLEKYRQIGILFDLYGKYNIPLFKASELLLLEKNTNIIGPIVLEEHSGFLYVMEGNTRLAYAYHHGIKEIMALVVKGVDTQLPVCPDFVPCGINRVLITDKKQDVNEGCHKYFRHIEAQLHPLN